MLHLPPPPIITALVIERVSIQLAIAGAVRIAFARATTCLGHRAGEVEKLIYFFMDGLPIIEHALNYVLFRHGVRVTVSGIFCHQTPKVSGDAPYNSVCELGDIAFLATYGAPEGNAMLMQAKEVYHPGVAQVQEDLYERATGFIYTSPHPLTGQSRDLTSVTSGLHYWSFDMNQWLLSSTESLLARPLAPAFVRFEEMLHLLFCGAAGQGFEIRTFAPTSWSQIIRDLVRNSTMRSINHRRIFSRRGSGPGRLRNYPYHIHMAAPGHAPSFVRCSLGEFLDLFDAETASAGRLLEEESRSARDDFEAGDNDPPDGNKTPPLDRGDGGEDDNGAGSFVVFQFSKHD